MKRVCKTCLIAGFVFILSLYSAHAADRSSRVATPTTSWTQAAELTASDGQPSDKFGLTVAVSGDTIVVGNFSSSQNEAYVFVKPASGWQDMTETARLTPSNGYVYGFGSSVAISGDTIAVGSPNVAVYVYVKPLTGWTDMTETAQLSDPAGSASPVSIDGNIIVSGSYSSGAFLFVKPPGGWQTTSTPTSSLNVPQYGLGYDLSVSVSGDSVAVGAPSNFGGEGTIYVFVKPSHRWPQILNPTATLIASDPGIEDYLGMSVEIQNDFIIAGSPFHLNHGAVYVFQEPAGGWADMTQTAELIAGSGQWTGWSVGITANGKTVLAGAPVSRIGLNLQQGAAFVFAEPANGWQSTHKFDAKLTASDGATYDEFGYSAAIFGRTALVGAPTPIPTENPPPGAAYVFVK